jgi:hypothetical protein
LTANLIAPKSLERLTKLNARLYVTLGPVQRDDDIEGSKSFVTLGRRKVKERKTRNLQGDDSTEVMFDDNDFLRKATLPWKERASSTYLKYVLKTC